MATTKSFNRTVEAINDLLDKLDNLPDYPLVFKGGLNNPSYLPSEATQGDLYLVMYANNDNTGLANSLYYRTHTNQWDIIANISYTKAQIDDKLDNIADNAELSTYTAGAGTSFETIANTDTVTDAIEKVQNNALLNKNNILSLAALRTYRLPTNDTSYSFTSLDGIDDTTRFKYALIVGGGTAATPTNALVWLLFISTDGACTFTKIIGNGAQVLTGAVSGTTLNITASATIYGGLRLIWLG